MTITITEKEYDAVCFAINQIESEVEAGSDESYLNDASDALSLLCRVCDKYKKKAYEFGEVVHADISAGAHLGVYFAHQPEHSDAG